MAVGRNTIISESHVFAVSWDLHCCTFSSINVRFIAQRGIATASPSASFSVTLRLRYRGHGHVGCNISKIISRLVSLGWASSRPNQAHYKQCVYEGRSSHAMWTSSASLTEISVPRHSYDTWNTANVVSTFRRRLCWRVIENVSLLVTSVVILKVRGVVLGFSVEALVLTFMCYGGPDTIDWSSIISDDGRIIHDKQGWWPWYLVLGCP